MDCACFANIIDKPFDVIDESILKSGEKPKVKLEDLSLGNLKKVGIVLALMHEPEILILDEPTSGLDPIMQNTFHPSKQPESNAASME